MPGKEAAKYDPSVIQEFARRLYDKADNLVFAWAGRLGVLGFILGTAGAAGLGMGGGSITVGFVCGVVAGVVGASLGREKGFELRLRAQEALCLLQTEINTRSLVDAENVAHVPSQAV